jgi:rare lipoprotein A (peptidoglycan hydrolase)
VRGERAVTPAVGLRAAALAGVALVAVAIALALSHRSTSTSDVPAPAGQWYTALAAAYTPSTTTKKGACGVVIRANTAGVAHPVLPCGAKIYIRFGHREVLTQVIDRGHTVPGHEFDVTQALAKLLGLQGTQTIQWRYAR